MAGVPAQVVRHDRAGAAGDKKRNSLQKSLHSICHAVLSVVKILKEDHTTMPDGAQMQRVRLALIGAGIYARDAYLPALNRLRDYFDLAAIWSRSDASAAALADRWRVLDQVERPSDGAASLELSTDLPALLARNDIDAVAIVLPIPAQPAVVAQALAAGKHIISEKPIAPSRKEALSLLELHRRHPECVWMVAENWRYEEAFVRSAELIRSGAIGRPLLAHWAQYSPSMRPDNKYSGSLWRRAGLFAGGLLLDGGVHHIAVLRLLLGEVTGASAVVQQPSPELPPADTLTATLAFAAGAQATYLNTFALGTPFAAPLVIVGERGSLRIERGRIEQAGGDGSVQMTECAIYNGVDNELLAFAAAIREGAPHRNTPLEALGDLAVIEAMLASAQDGQQHAPAVI
jgi:predicted dehydrogenase